MKKITALVMIALLAVMMCACGGNKEPESVNVTEIPEFHSVDLEGNEVDNSIFANADITVVNVWGTYCIPCIAEMPLLAQWAGELPDNVQIVGIVVDCDSVDSEEFEDAKMIIGESKAPFTNIIAGDQFRDGLFDEITGVPTTFFVDSEGKCIAEAIVGADIEGYKETVEGLL